ncbi:MAG: (d)CMP kinase [Cycloclasticus sp.]
MNTLRSVKSLHIGKLRHQLRQLGKRLQREYVMPVIAIDGPAASGKGIIAEMLAREMRWSYLDSGVLYRAVAYVAQERGITLQQTEALIHLAGNPPFILCKQAPWVPPYVFFEGRDISQSVRTEEIASYASEIATIPGVREVLMPIMLDEQKSPGLIADGRDMGTVVFPEAALKFFTISQPEVRAQRRFQQEAECGGKVSLSSTLQAIQVRDKRDQMRAMAPLQPALDSMVIDTTKLTVLEVFQCVVNKAVERAEY